MARTSISTILPRATVKLITENARPSNVRDRIWLHGRSLDPTTCAAGQLPRRCRRLAYDLSDVLERHCEYIMKHEGHSLGWPGLRFNRTTGALGRRW